MPGVEISTLPLQWTRAPVEGLELQYREGKNRMVMDLEIPVRARMRYVAWAYCAVGVLPQRVERTCGASAT